MMMTTRWPNEADFQLTHYSLRLTVVCECDACQRDGQHEPMCQVHDEDVAPDERRCDCGRRKLGKVADLI